MSSSISRRSTRGISTTPPNRFSIFKSQWKISGHLLLLLRRTALHLAACEGWTEVVVLLLEKGADVNSLDRWGHTPLSDARSLGHHKICKILEARGGIDLVGVDSQTPCFGIYYTEVDIDEAILIGKGAYGEVYLVKWRGTEVTAKAIRSIIASNPKAKNTVTKELALWQRLRHPNIVQFPGILNHPDCLVFLTEYLRNGRLNPKTAIAYALDIARGMNYLHQHRPDAIIHQNLTARNVLQDEAGALRLLILMFGGPSNRAETAEQVAYRRAYKDSRPPLSSYKYPEPIKM
ncbi:hypothetical protein CRYUN_Cryun20dG0025200 [Craigia yunnanensis]